MPKIFRLTKGGKLAEGIFEADTINTPSMLCVEDALDGLRWAEEIGGLPELIRRSQANLAAVAGWVERTPWVEFLADDPAIRSSTSICLKIVDPWFTALPAEEQAQAAQEDGLAAGGRRRRPTTSAPTATRPPGLRLWGGATVQRATTSKPSSPGWTGPTRRSNRARASRPRHEMNSAKGPGDRALRLGAAGLPAGGAQLVCLTTLPGQPHQHALAKAAWPRPIHRITCSKRTSTTTPTIIAIGIPTVGATW